MFDRKQQLWATTHHGHISTSALIAPDGILMEKFRTPKICGQPGASITQLNIHSPDVPHDLKGTKQLDGTPEIRYPPDSVTLMIANFIDEELTLHKGTILGVAQEISENLVVSVSDEENTDRGTEQTFFSGSNKEVPKGFNP